MKRFPAINYSSLIKVGAGFTFASTFLSWRSREEIERDLSPKFTGWSNSDGLYITVLAAGALAFTLLNLSGKNRSFALLALIFSALTVVTTVWIFFSTHESLAEINAMAPSGPQSSQGIGIYFTMLSAAVMTAGCILRFREVLNAPRDNS